MAFSSISSSTAQRPDYSVPQAGNDGIASLCWSPTQNILISTNWDGGVRCWEVQEQVGQVQAVPKAQGELIFYLNFPQKVKFCSYEYCKVKK